MTVLDGARPFAPPVATPGGLARARFRAMGTDVDVLLPAGREGAAAIVVSIFEAWERRCSRFDPQSELSRLNAAAGAPVIVSRPLFEAVSSALEAAAATDGVFDPTVLRRLEALGYDRTFSDVVCADAGDAGDPTCHPWTGAWRQVRLDRATHAVEMPGGVGLDLGGMAKGMTVDAALAALVDAGIDRAAVNAGGDLAVHGTPPDGVAWLIGVETCDGGLPVALAQGALATSSVANRRWLRGGRILNHLIDPRTGLPAATGLTSVTVSAGTCAQAEVAAKTTLLLGLEDGAAFLDRTGLSALVVDAAGTHHRIGRWLEPGDAQRHVGTASLAHPAARIAADPVA